MNTQFFLILTLIFCKPLSAMEQGASVLKPLQRSNKIPSLQTIVLKAYAQQLHETTPEKELSDEDMIGWCQKQGVDYFFDSEVGDLSRRFRALLVMPGQKNHAQCIATTLYCPNVFASDVDCAWRDDWEREQQYIVHKDGSIVFNTSPKLYYDSSKCGKGPFFTSQGRWLVGWEKPHSFLESPRKLILLHCGAYANEMKTVPTFEIPFDSSHKIDWAFPSDDTIIVRTATEIFIGPINDFAQKGIAALKKLYTRSDNTEYPSPLFYRTVHALSDAIVCVGPNQKSLEIMRANKLGTLECVSTLTIPDIQIGMLIVNSVRGIAALHVSATEKDITLYQIEGKECGKKGTIQVESLDACIFSPCGEFLACGTNFNRQVIEIFDCKNLEQPVRVALIPNVVTQGTAHCIAWTIYGLIVRDGWGDQHNIEFNSAAPLVERYAAYRKKQEADAQQKPKKIE